MLEILDVIALALIGIVSAIGWYVWYNRAQEALEICKLQNELLGIQVDAMSMMARNERKGVRK